MSDVVESTDRELSPDELAKLSPEEREDYEIRQELKAQKAEARKRIENAGDGVLVVKLLVPVKLDGQEHSRILVGKVRVRHVRKAGGEDHVWAYADQLCSPAGLFDELESDLDHAAVCVAVEEQLGKFQRAGRG